MFLAIVQIATGQNQEAVFRWSEFDEKCCSVRWTDGKEWKTINHDSISVSARLEDSVTTGHFLLIAVIDNWRQTAIELRPELFSLRGGQSREVFAIPFEKMVARHGAFGRMLTAASGMQAQEDAWNSWVDTAALKRTTIDPGKVALGATFFPRENKRHKDVLLRLPVAGTVYEFILTPR